MDNYSNRFTWKKILAASGLAIMLGISSFSVALADGQKDQNDSDHNYQRHRENDNADRNKDSRRDWNRDRNDHWRSSCNNRGRWNGQRYGMVSFGTVDSVDSKEIKVKYWNNKTFTVNAEDAKVINRKGDKINLDDIKEGDKIVVRGERKWNNDHKEFSVDAQLIRDISRD